MRRCTDVFYFLLLLELITSLTTIHNTYVHHLVQFWARDPFYAGSISYISTLGQTLPLHIEFISMLKVLKKGSGPK